jgi:hypothetical protein
MKAITLYPKIVPVPLSHADRYTDTWIEYEYGYIKEYTLYGTIIPTDAIIGLSDGDTIELHETKRVHDFKGTYITLSSKESCATSNPYDGDVSKNTYTMKRNGNRLQLIG